MSTTKYLITHDLDLQWGIVTKTVGQQDVPPHSSYPIGKHPEEYLFSPNRGRLLQEIQILYISKGRGWFVSAHHPKTQLLAGDAVILYPGEWHSYTPDPDSGWRESWIGFTGKMAENLIGKLLSDKTSPIYKVGVHDLLCDAFNAACEVSETQLPAYQEQLAGYVSLIIYTIYARSRQLPYLGNPDIHGINIAIKYMRLHLNENIRMEDVSREAQMGYSKFRKLFREYTGFAPAQYFLQLKMERAKGYLLNTTLSCKEIAYRLGFDSSSYFNKMFRIHQGMTPLEFRSTRDVRTMPNG